MRNYISNTYDTDTGFGVAGASVTITLTRYTDTKVETLTHTRITSSTVLKNRPNNKLSFKGPGHYW